MKSDFSIERISKAQAFPLLNTYHYLSSIQKGFKSKINYGLLLNNTVVGVCIFTGFPVPELAVGMFGLDKTDQDGFFELSRFVLEPTVQSSEHNIASWFLSKCLKLLYREESVRAVLSYADSDYHCGTLYAACNFNYYGLTAPKKDFWIKQHDGSFVKHSRGKVKNIEGEWRPRSRKHRFVLIKDKTLTMNWNKVSWKSHSHV
jgi:hypothetical protein